MIKQTEYYIQKLCHDLDCSTRGYDPLRVDIDKLAYAEMLKERATPAERFMLKRLRDFEFQEVICGYIADFVHYPTRLIIELDGEIHDEWNDERRDSQLLHFGFHTLRFTNQEVLRFPNNVQWVIEDCVKFLKMHKKLPKQKYFVDWHGLRKTAQ